MAMFAQPIHSRSLERQKLKPSRSDTPTPSTSEASEADANMRNHSHRALSASSVDSRSSIFIVFIFFLEFLLLVFMIILAYFLRFTDAFSVRHLLFSCSDPAISYSTNGSSYRNFRYRAQVPFEVVISLSFCLPPVVIIIGELALWAFTTTPQKTIRALCRPCKVPQLCRRMIRFIGAFLFGLFLTMIITDVTKLMTGRLRPGFLEVCRPNASLCMAGPVNDEGICLERDRMVIRNARLSFPSMHAAMTAYAAGYMAVYLHNIIRTHSIRLLRPMLAFGFIIMSVMCCLQRYGNHYSHIEDVACGFALGIIIAIYMSVFVLNNFREMISGQAMYNKLKQFLAEYQTRELRSITDEHYEYYNSYGNPIFFPPPSNNYTMGIHIPRPHTRSPDPPVQHVQQVTVEHEHFDERARKRQQNTFQRDLARTLQYRRNSDDSIGQSHM